MVVSGFKAFGQYYGAKANARMVFAGTAVEPASKERQKTLESLEPIYELSFRGVCTAPLPRKVRGGARAHASTPPTPRYIARFHTTCTAHPWPQPL